MVEVQPGRQGVELVDGLAARRDLAGAEAGHAVHLGRVDAVEVDRVRVVRAVDERDPQALALAAAQRRAGDAPVVGPGRELHARGDLDLLVDREQLPLAHARGRSPAGASCPSRSRAGSRAGRSRWRRGRRSGRRGSRRGRRRVRRPRGGRRAARRAPRASHGWLWGIVLCRSPAPAEHAGSGEQLAASQFGHAIDYGMPKSVCREPRMNSQRAWATMRSGGIALGIGERAAVPPRRRPPTARAPSAPGRASPRAARSPAPAARRPPRGRRRSARRAGRERPRAARARAATSPGRRDRAQVAVERGEQVRARIVAAERRRAGTPAAARARAWSRGRPAPRAARARSSKWR